MTPIYGPETYNQFNDGSTGPKVLPGGPPIGTEKSGQEYSSPNTGQGKTIPPLPRGNGNVGVNAGPNTGEGGGIPPLGPGNGTFGPEVQLGGGGSVNLKPFNPNVSSPYNEPRNWQTSPPGAPNPKTPPQPPLEPPTVSVPPNPCIELHEYGHVLWDYGFQWRDEIISFVSSPSISRIAAFDDMSFQTLVNARNNEFSYSGRKYRVVCTGYYIKDYLCDVASVSYSTLSSYNVSFAKYNIPILGGEFYITTNGKLCTLDIIPTTTGTTPNLGDDARSVPPYQPPITPTGPTLGSGQVYGTIYSDDIIGGIREVETKELWAKGVTCLQNHWRDITASLNDCDFVIDVWDGDLSDDCSTIQYRIFYCDYDGKGAVDLGGMDNETLTKAMYSQYANVLLPKGQAKFVIDGSEQDYVYVIDVKRERYGTAMDTGNWELNLGRISSSITSGNSPSSSISFISWASTGSYVDRSLETGSEVYLTNRVYDVVQGTLEAGLTTSGSVIGNFYPNHGTIVLSGQKLDTLFNFNTNRNIQKHGLNPYRLFTSISGASAAGIYTDASGDDIGFRGRKLLINHSSYVFVRVKNQLFNFSNNPTYVSGSEGVIIDSFQLQEKAWITTVGLYNANKELLAVGKLPKPYLKSCTEEALFTVKVTQ